MEKLNLYGDVFTKIQGTHGSDIASQHLDDLDKFVLRQVCQYKEAKVLDIGERVNVTKSANRIREGLNLIRDMKQTL